MSLVSFREVLEEDAGKILRWRLMPRVADQMTTVVPPDLELQKKWIRNRRSLPSYYHWIIQISNADSGLLSLTNFVFSSSSASWGFYIGEDKALGLGAVVPPYFYNWVFSTLGIDRLDVEVYEKNATVLAIHEFHGFRRVPSKDRVALKGGLDWPLVALTLSKSEWQERERFHKFLTPLPTSKWSERPASLH